MVHLISFNDEQANFANVQLHKMPLKKGVNNRTQAEVAKFLGLRSPNTRG